MQLNIRNWKNGMAAFAVAGLLAMGGGYVANAQADTTADTAATVTDPRDVAQSAIAEALGLTPEELQDQLWAGQTLADLAEEAGVDISELRDTAQAAQQAQRIEQIQASVEAGDITQEQADWMIEGIEQGYMQNGFGRDGFGRDGFGRGSFGMESRGMQGGRGGHDFGRGFGDGFNGNAPDNAPGMNNGRGPAQPSTTPETESDSNSSYVLPSTPQTYDGSL